MTTDNNIVGRMGYLPPLRACAPQSPRLSALQKGGAPPPWDGAWVNADTALVSVTSRNHLHFARVMFESVKRIHPGVDLFLALADAVDGLPEEIPGVRTASGRSLDPDDFAYKTLKYSAYEYCCALKPFAIRALLDRGYRRIIYLDGDVCLYAPLTEMLAQLDRHAFVVTPHIRASFQDPERFWERPSLGDLVNAGPLNAGIFGINNTSEVRAFISEWARMVSEPGTFLERPRGQTEQNAFNWVTCFVGGVHVLRDPAYNAAYWNLHERSLRWRGLDDPRAVSEFTVDGRPLVAFHFSGFSLAEEFRLSKHHHRASLNVLPSAAHLLRDYAERLRAQEASRYSGLPYAFDAFPSGIPIDARMRLAFKEHETELRLDVSPWEPEGERAYCEALLSPVGSRGSLLPILLQQIYESRPDLQAALPHAPIEPDALLVWFRLDGVDECGYRKLYDTHRPTLPIQGDTGPRRAPVRRPCLARRTRSPAHQRPIGPSRSAEGRGFERAPGIARPL